MTRTYLVWGLTEATNFGYVRPITIMYIYSSSEEHLGILMIWITYKEVVINGTVGHTCLNLHTIRGFF